jgi:FixJ family two-component response regulator
MEFISRDTSVVPVPRSDLHEAFSGAFDTPNADADGEVAYLVNGELSLREDISTFLAETGMRVIAFASAEAYLTFKRRDTAACVILNISLPDLSGLELQRRLAKNANPPVIFISDQCDIASSVCAMKAGAIEFLTTPLDWLALVSAVKAAFAKDRRQRQQRAELARLQERFSLLTPREREVLPLIVGGLLNKQAASALGISEVTLQIHRSHVMRKMRAGSFADLVRMAVKLHIRHWRESQLSHGLRSHLDMAPEQHRNGKHCLAVKCL